MNKKIISVFFLTLSLMGVFLFVNVSKAEEVKKSPAENPLCWIKKDCEAIRKDRGWGGNGFIQDKECGGNDLKTGDDNYSWGKCLAGGQTNLQVYFAGVTTTPHVGRYIEMVYNYALIILSILASVMIIVAGIQYVGSAGNQEMISSAKKRIIGAVIGLSLAYMSYTILNMVNPSTLELRLPSVFMIREISLPKWCMDVEKPKETKVSEFTFTQSLSSLEVFKKNNIDKSTEVHKTNEPVLTKCGAEYSITTGICIGVDCDGRKNDKNQICGKGSGIMCLCLKDDANPIKYSCKEGTVGGSITLSSNVGSYVDDITLLAVCGTTTGENYLDYVGASPASLRVDKFDANKNTKNFVFNVTASEISDYCKGTKGTFKGFLMAVEMHDTSGKYNVNDSVFLATKSDCSGSGFSPKVGSVILIDEYLRKWNNARIQEIKDKKLNIESHLYNLGPIIDNPDNIIPYTALSAVCDLVINAEIDNKITQVSEGVIATVCYDEGGNLKCQNEFK